MMLYLFIALGGALGSVARFSLGQFVESRWESSFPWGTFLVNITGCIAIGAFAAATAPTGRWTGNIELRHFLLTGLCGGYTTFSAFSLQTVVLIRAGDWPRVGAYVAGSVLLCLAGVWIGHALAQSWQSPPAA